MSRAQRETEPGPWPRDVMLQVPREDMISIKSRPLSDPYKNRGNTTRMNEYMYKRVQISSEAIWNLKFKNAQVYYDDLSTLTFQNNLDICALEDVFTFYFACNMEQYRINSQLTYRMSP